MVSPTRSMEKSELNSPPGDLRTSSAAPCAMNIVASETMIDCIADEEAVDRAEPGSEPERMDQKRIESGRQASVAKLGDQYDIDEKYYGARRQVQSAADQTEIVSPMAASASAVRSHCTALISK